MPEFFKVVRCEDALALLRDNFPHRRAEEIDLSAALNRVLARDIVGQEDIPGFERSTVDGYAVRARDTFGSSESMPGFLTMKGEVVMGEQPEFSIREGWCAWIPTGGMLPPGADAVVMVEHTERLGEDTVLVNRPVGPYDNVIRVGEDARKGETIFAQGHRLRPQDIGVLAALGLDRVEVVASHRVGIISSGDEIVPITCTPNIGQVRDVNSYSLAAAVEKAGGTPRVYGVIPDNMELLTATLAKAVRENHLVILSGGSSIGQRDFSLKAMLSLPEASMLFHGVAARPGKPTLAVRVDGGLIVGLPGHPVAALMMFEIFCAPLLGTAAMRRVRATLTANVASQAGRDDFVRVELIDDGERMLANPVHGKSGLVRVMSQAQGYVHIPYEKQGIKAGEPVLVTLF